MNRKGIILAGGSGTRLFPSTLVTSKQLIPVYDKPMIYYPLATLMQAGIKEFMLITTPWDLPRFQSLLGTGDSLGIDIQYDVQEEPKGIAEAILISETFIGKDNIALILGDNLFHGNLKEDFAKASNKEAGATIFAYHVHNPKDYGVVSFYHGTDDPMHIIEKPKNPGSNYAVTGLYFYDNSAIAIAKNIAPSSRGELEITDVNQAYLDSQKLSVVKLSRGIAWLDTGNHESLLEASTYVQAVEKRTGLKIGCIEEIAFKEGLINPEQLFDLGTQNKTEYGKYLVNLAREHL